MNLLVTIPFHSGDLTLAQNLLAWIEELGKLPANNCLLVTSATLTKAQIEPVAKAAQAIFKSVSITAPPFALPDEKWPRGANWMFETAAQWIVKNKPSPWLWLEPDAVPLRAGWLGEIEAAYAEALKAKRSFLGQIVKPKQAGLPAQMLSGVAVYPAGLPKAIYQRLLQTKRNIAWDVCCAPTIVPLAQASPLFWNWHNQKMPPTFVRKKQPGQPENALALGIIPKQAVLAHTSKDGSLISLLRGDSEADLGQLYMMWKQKFAEPGSERASAWVAVKKPLRFVHAVERHVGDMEALRRSTDALRSWTALYKTGRLVPAHLWEHDYPRSSRQLNDPRGLPFLKDVLVEGMTKAGPDDVIVLTNDDTLLHKAVLDALEEKLKTVSACGSFRLNFSKGEVPKMDEQLAKILHDGTPDLGRDLFAFRKQWLKEHWFNLPDFLLGELEWDLVMSVMVRRSASIFTNRKNITEPMPACEIERGYVMHEKHEAGWVTTAQKQSGAKQHNKRLAIEWYAKNSYPSLISTF